MKFKKLIIPNFVFENELGKFQFHDASVLVDASSEITPSSFNQETDDYSISSFEIERMNREAESRFEDGSGNGYRSSGGEGHG